MHILDIAVNGSNERMYNSALHEMDHPGYADMSQELHSLVPRAQESRHLCSLTLMASSQRSPGFGRGIGTSEKLYGDLATRVSQQPPPES